MFNRNACLFEVYALYESGCRGDGGLGGILCSIKICAASQQVIRNPTETTEFVQDQDKRLKVYYVLRIPSSHGTANSRRGPVCLPGASQLGPIRETSGCLLSLQSFSHLGPCASLLSEVIRLGPGRREIDEPITECLKTR